jgi:hypothetical protein
LKLVVFLALLLGTGVALAEKDPPNPYRIWWSFPRDDLSAIEIDDPDLHVSDFPSKWVFASKMATCDKKAALKAMKKRAAGEGTPLRELRIETLDASGNVHDTTRCVMPLASWRLRLGQALAERLEDELDAHMSFLLPRKFPRAPAVTPAQVEPPPSPPQP